MRARFALAGEHLLPLGTLSSVKQALKHMRDMMRLCRADNMGLRDIIPAMMLRLDLDQDCYDFVKWWATGTDDNYDRGDMSLPYLSTRDADPFEHPGYILGKFASLNGILAILLLKLKILVDIRYIRTARRVLARFSLPPEMSALVERDVVRSPLSRKLAGKPTKFLLQTQSTLIKQIRKLGAALVKANSYFMVHLFNPDEALSQLPSAYSMGSPEEMILAMRNWYAAFWETAGVLDLLVDARACAARDAHDEIEKLLRKSCYSHTIEEVRETVGLKHLWGFLDRAVEDAISLRRPPRSTTPPRPVPPTQPKYSIVA
ncbi:hypothetical protein NQ176_g4221 [Zarea fungicola]|uniref:Uncharacterized protein n=1 Tax=Zarea fungicola TaxID=93591 RepID=A0ACC1NH17_9HYPO|nr:hypothetical protein NQ176_g4221 [Lecanicillium fungicola]